MHASVYVCTSYVYMSKGYSFKEKTKDNASSYNLCSICVFLS